MKIKLFLFTLALCLVLGGLFASCGKNGASNGGDTDTADSTYFETENETSPESETDTLETVPPEAEAEEDARTPIENEKALSLIEYQYAKALEAISFANGALPYDNSTEIINEDGYICYPITDSTAREELEGEAISSLEDLSKYLKSIFARSIADHLIDTARSFYTDADGTLCLITGRTADGSEAETESVTEETQKTETVPAESESENEEEPAAPVVASTEFFLSEFTEKLFRYTAKVSFEGIEEAEYFDFIFENTGNGWYFTSFPALPE